MDKLLIAVDKNDKFLGRKTWQECHQGKGILHRAFSVFVFNSRGELLLQKRSQKKLLWPLFWSNTCCSHPIIPRHPDHASDAGERSLQEVMKQAKDRLQDELGFSCPLKFIDKLYYTGCKANTPLLAAGMSRRSDQVGLAQPRKKKPHPLAVRSLHYHACWKDVGCEREITYILVGKYDGQVSPNKKEVADYQWRSIASLKEDIRKQPEEYTPWLREIIKNKLLYC